MDSSRRAARLVPVVLSLLHGPPLTRRGSSPDQAMEGDETTCPPDPAALRAGRCHVPQTPATGAAALGLRQPKDLTLEMPQSEMVTMPRKGVGRDSELFPGPAQDALILGDEKVERALE